MLEIRDLSVLPPPPPPVAPTDTVLLVPPRPDLPFGIAEYEQYGGRKALQRVYTNGIRSLPLSDEEVHIFGHIAYLRAEVERLSALVPDSALPTSGQTVTSSDTNTDTTPELVPGAEHEPTPTPDVTPPTDADTTDATEDTNTTSSPESEHLAGDKRARAERELLADSTASNPVLAARANCSDEYVRIQRKRLEQEGRLPVRRDAAA